MSRIQSRAFLAVTVLLLEIPGVFACISASTAPFPAVGPTSLTVDWVTACSSGTLHAVHISTDPAFTVWATTADFTPPTAFASLTPNTTYHFRASTDGFPASGVALGSTPTWANPPSPGVPGAAALSPTQVRVNWSANGNPPGTFYRIELSTDGFATVAASSRTAGLSADFGGLAPLTSYFSRGRGENLAGVLTAPIVLGSTGTPPAVPAPLPITNVQPDGFLLSWGPNGNPPATVYAVSWSTRSDFGGSPEVRTVAASSYQVTGALPNTPYYAKVGVYLQASEQSLGSVTTLAGGGDQVFTSTDGALVLEVPGGAVGEAYTVQFNTGVSTVSLVSPDRPPAIQDAEEKLSANTGDARREPVALVEVVGRDAEGDLLPESLAEPAQLTVAYALDGDQVAGAPPGTRPRTLAIHYLDERDRVWVRLPSSRVDLSSRTVTAAAPLFAVYAVIGRSDASLEEAYAYPVPFDPARHPDIVFVNLAQRATIRLFDVEGREVARIEETDGDGRAAWDLQGREGRVAPGVYVFLIESDSDVKSGKLMVLP